MTVEFKYPNDVGFVCNLCGRCCGNTEEHVRRILLLKMDAKRIINKTSLDVSEFADETSGSEPYIHEMKKTEDDKCFFLKNNMCTIYEIRPLICRFYPFELKNLGNKNYSFSYTTKCPGIGKGLPLKRNFFENLFNKATAAMKENAKTC